MQLKISPLSISEIRNGTVIDHIDAGKGLLIVKLLKLDLTSKKVLLGLNLSASSMGYKDIIKLEDRELSEEEANQLAILSSKITINIVKNLEIQKKFKLSIPNQIENVIICPNIKCITNFEKVSTLFFVHQRSHSIQLRCKYCENVFMQEEIKTNYS
jgi:aspartate carbamoyltransferase regulatory subunit